LIWKRIPLLQIRDNIYLKNFGEWLDRSIARKMATYGNRKMMMLMKINKFMNQK
jgi:hypothetical protein